MDNTEQSTAVVPILKFRKYGSNSRKIHPDEATFKKVFALGRMQCSQGEAAAALGVTKANFQIYLNQFAEAKEFWELGKRHGRMSLRRRYFEMAMEDPAMMRHAAKHILKMEKDDDSAAAVQAGVEAGIGVGRRIGRAEAEARVRELLGKLAPAK